MFSTGFRCDHAFWRPQSTTLEECKSIVSLFEKELTTHTTSFWHAETLWFEVVESAQLLYIFSRIVHKYVPDVVCNFKNNNSFQNCLELYTWSVRLSFCNAVEKEIISSIADFTFRIVELLYPRQLTIFLHRIILATFSHSKPLFSVHDIHICFDSPRERVAVPWVKIWQETFKINARFFEHDRNRTTTGFYDHVTSGLWEFESTTRWTWVWHC